MVRSSTSPPATLLRLISWHRRKLAVLAAMGATAAGITAATPEPAPSTAVLVAAHRLDGGERVAAADVTVRRMPTALLPELALTDPGQVLGRTLVAPLSGGSVLTRVALLGSRPGVAADGMVIVPLRISDPAVAGLLRIGDRVDVVAADPQTGRGAQVIADQVRVVTIPKASANGSALDPGTAESSSLVLVAAPPETAPRLADAAAGSQVTVLLRP